MNKPLRNLAFAFALFATGCQGSSYVRMTLNDLPPGVTEIIVQLNLGGHDSDPEKFEVSNADTTQSLALKVPGSIGTWVELAVAARDLNGCDIAFQSAANPFTPDQVNELTYSMVAIDPPACGVVLVPAMLPVINDDPVQLGCVIDDPDCLADEARRVAVVPPFQIDIYEVSAGAYEDCVSAGVCSVAHDQAFTYGPIPATFARYGIDWNQASTFCSWRGKRLPSEAEWTAAARSSEERIYPWGNDPPSCTLANYSPETGTFCTQGASGQVGLRSDGSSAYGLFDMAGNVAEWTNDWYEDTVPDEEALTGPSSGTYRVTKGGSFLLDASLLRVSSRYYWPPDGVGDFGVDATTGTFAFGFRCAR